MFTYVQLNQENVVVGISHLSGQIEVEGMVNVTELEQKPQIGYIYNRETNAFTAPAPEPQPEPEPHVTLEERIEQLQQDNLVLMDALAMAYEQNTQDNLTIMSAIAELYENQGGVTE